MVLWYDEVEASACPLVSSSVKNEISKGKFADIFFLIDKSFLFFWTTQYVLFNIIKWDENSITDTNKTLYFK